MPEQLLDESNSSPSCSEQLDLHENTEGIPTETAESNYVKNMSDFGVQVNQKRAYFRSKGM